MSIGDSVTVLKTGTDGDVTVTVGASGENVQFGPGVARAISVVSP